MKKILALVWICAAALTGGCATSIGTYEQRVIASDEAIVLVGLDSEISISGVTICNVFCEKYPFGGRKDVMALPVHVGESIKVNSIRTMDRRVATLNGEQLKIERRGVYYYGSIYSDHSKVGIVTKPSPRLLLAAKRKYGSRFDDMEAVNFTWPDATATRNIDIAYQDSPKVQALLQAHAGKRLQLAKVAPPSHFDASCRGSGEISLPDFFPYEEYIRRAFNHELRSAGLYDESADALVLNGELTDLAFTTNGGSSWKMGLKVETQDGHAAKASVAVPYKASWVAASACASAEDAVPSSVQRLIEDLVASPDFQKLLADPPLPPSKEIKGDKVNGVTH